MVGPVASFPQAASHRNRFCSSREYLGVPSHAQTVCALP